jgi:hypothetical protein
MKRLDTMKGEIMAVVLITCAVLMPVAVIAAGSSAINGKVELLLVQNSQDVVIDKGKNTLTLEGVSPTTIYFSDRPDRIAGHFNENDYLKTWSEGKDSFDADPPNAVLSVFEGDQDYLLDVVVTLNNPRYEGNDLTYDITLIDGDLPVLGGPASLFIDILGVRRRALRRGVMIGSASAATAAAATHYAEASPPPAPPAAATPPEPTAAPAMTGSQAAAVASLKELKSLQAQGLITEQQYQQQSQELLDEITK